MVIAALALDRLDDDGRDVDLILVDVRLDLLLGFLLALDYVCLALRFRQGKINGGTGNARPNELREQIRLARIGIRQAHGVTGASVESVTEMQDFGAAF